MISRLRHLATLATAAALLTGCGSTDPHANLKPGIKRERPKVIAIADDVARTLRSARSSSDMTLATGLAALSARASAEAANLRNIPPNRAVSPQYADLLSALSKLKLDLDVVVASLRRQPTQGLQDAAAALPADSAALTRTANALAAALHIR